MLVAPNRHQESVPHDVPRLLPRFIVTARGLLVARVTRPQRTLLPSRSCQTRISWPH